MTEKLKKPLFNSSKLFIIFLLVSLVACFVFAAIFDHTIFYFIIAGLIFILFFLVPLRNKINSKYSEQELRLQHIQEQKNLITAEISQEEATIKSFRDKIINYSQLKGLTEKLSLCLSLEDTSKTLSAEVNKLFGDEETTIILYLFHSKTGDLGISVSQKGQMRVNLKTKQGDIFDQWIVRTMQPLLIEDTKSEYRFDMDKVSSEETRPIRSLISIPLKVGHKALGILRVDSPKEKHFDTESLRFLTAIGDLGALAIENAQLYAHVEQLAIRDSLTDLYLRKYLLDRLSEEIGRQMRRQTEMSFLMIDLDKFKQYNDKFGHIAGDIVLRTIGLLLADFFNSPGNLVCRYGGEEFSVLLPDCPKAKAIEIAEEIRKKISERTILLRREKTHITVSIGVSSFPGDAQEKNELIHRADQALYKAKEQGRNRVCVA